MKAKSVLNVALDDNSVDARTIADDSIGMNHLNDFLIKNVHLSGRNANQGNGAAITNDKIVAGTIETDSLKDSLIITSKDFLAILAESGFPPKVEPCSPGRRHNITSLLARTAEIGIIPPDNALPRTNISGFASS